MALVKLAYKNQQEWLNARKQGIGGSDAAAICGLNPYKTPLQVYMEKIGEVDPPQDNRFMEWGRLLEPVIADYFSQKTGLEVAPLPKIILHPEHNFMLGNIDRQIVGKKEGLEIKTISNHRWDGNIPDEFSVQCYHYLAITGWERWHLAILIGGNDFRHYIIERDEEIINHLIKIEKRFWTEHVLKRIPPEPGGQDKELIEKLFPRSNGETIKIETPEAIEYLKEYTRLQEEEKRIKEKKEELQNKIKYLLAEKEKARIGEYIVSWQTVKSTKFNTKSFQKDHPDLFEKYTYTTEYRRFSVK